MSKKLQKHLASLELTKPGHRTDQAEITDAEVINPQDGEGLPELGGRWAPGHCLRCTELLNVSN